MIELADTLLRAAIAAMFVLVAATLLKSHRNSVAAMLGVILQACLFAWIMTVSGSGKEFVEAMPIVLRLPVYALALANVYAFWAFMRAVFDDRFRVQPWLMFVFALAVICETVLKEWGGLWPNVASRLADAALMLHIALDAHVVVFTIRSGKFDLIKARREFRAVLLLSAPVYGVLLTGLVLMRNVGLLTDSVVAPFRTAGALLVLLAIVLRTARLRDRNELFGSEKPASSLQGIDGQGQNPISEQDQQILTGLTMQMDENRIYMKQGLTIGNLANAVGIPEHRLRSLINRKLGYRNFNSFLNGYRVDEACRMLERNDPDELPIISIAFDVGYSSLAPFNRAFKEISGVTPTAYRAGERRQSAN